MNRRIPTNVLAVCFGCLAFFATAQPSRGDLDNPKPVKCKIVNKTGKAVRIKIVGYNNEFVRDFNKDEEYITERPRQYLMEGYRVAVAWDTFKEEVVATAKITIDGKTLIEVESTVTATSWKE